MIGDIIALALQLIGIVVDLVVIVVIVNVVFSWLFAFDVISRRNEFIDSIYRFTAAVTDPLLRPLRRIIPPIGGMDLTPIVLLVGLQFLVPLLTILLRPLLSSGI
jgi:YggT family protein